MASADIRSMNEASERDPHNNNSYGTLVDRPYLQVDLPILDVNDFNERIIRGYDHSGWDNTLQGSNFLHPSISVPPRLLNTL